MSARSARIGIAVACVLLVVLGGPRTVRAAGDDPFAKAGELYEKEDFAGAAKLYRQAARSGRQAAIAWFNYANCQARLGNRGEAAQAWRKAIEWAPGFRRARLNLAILAEEDRDWAVATVQYRRLWELDPKDVSVVRRLGEIQLEQGDPVGSLLWFGRALELDSLSLESWSGMVRATLATSDTVSARSLLDRCEAVLQDTASGAWFSLSSLQERAGNLEAARRAVEHGLVLEPSRVEGWLRLARLAQMRGEDATAVAVLRQSVSRLPAEGRLWKALGQAGLRAGDADAAWTGLSGAVERREPDCGTFLRILADWHERRGEANLAARARALLETPAPAGINPARSAP